MLYDIPIEKIPDRYSESWFDWFLAAYNIKGVDFKRIYPRPLSNQIQHGSFLDAIVTNHFKAQQLEAICLLFHNNEVKNGDIFFFHDLWFPGLEMLGYIRDMLKIDFKIYGMLHAGTYDAYDKLTQQGMEHWAKQLEESWFSLIDGIFVATKFHRQLIISKRSIDPTKIHVTGFPIYDIRIKTDKENIVVFPHRLDTEKCPELFDKLKAELGPKFPNWSFVKTKDVCLTKDEYYNLLAKSKIVVSFALQETWGIAMQEAVILGCFPLVPDRLSYSEMYPPRFKYNQWDDFFAKGFTRS